MGARNFNECSRNGGRVKTKKLKNGKVIKICYDNEGKSHTKVIKKRDKVMSEQKKEVATEVDIKKLKEHFDKQMGR